MKFTLRYHLLTLFKLILQNGDLQCSFSLHLFFAEDTEVGRDQLLQRILRKVGPPPPPPPEISPPLACIEILDLLGSFEA